MDVTAERLPAAARNDVRLAAWLSLVGLLAVTAFIDTSKPPKDFVYLWSSVAAQTAYIAVLLAINFAIAGREDPRAMFALRRPRSWGKALGMGVALIVLVYIVAAVSAAAFNLDPGKDQGLTPDSWDSSRAPQFIANLIVIACIVPIAEELMFRGLGFSLLERFGEWAAILVVGALFAAVHGFLAGLPILMVFGAGLAFIRSRSGSVVPCMIIHGTFNAISLILAVTL